ncbi:MAG: Histidine kinase [Gemmataceae bacterium]|nr:Histidine kinase [Gemmataceae bacterium]
MTAEPGPRIDPALLSRGDELFGDEFDRLCRRTSRLFARFLVVQWAAAVALAAWVSPSIWTGVAGRAHPHVWIAVGLGGVVVVYAVRLAVTRPTRVLTRHVVAVAQMVIGAVLIHLLAGRIEAHFHVFGSLAFLSIYRDPRVLMTGAAVVTADHLAQGYLWPVSIYGTADGADWRWVEYVVWMVFECAFLAVAVRLSVREMRASAHRRAGLERAHEAVEQAVLDRTTELTRRTEELRASEARFRTLASHSPVGIFETDAAGRRTYINDRLCAIAGVPADVPTAGLITAVHPDDRARVTRAWQAAVASGGCMALEYRFVHPDGGVAWAMTRAVALRDAAGATTGFVGTVVDITPIKRGEETLRVLFECSSDAHLLFAEAGGIIDCNRAAVDMLRCKDKAEVLGLHPAVLSPEFQPDGRRSLEKCVEMDATARRTGHHRFDWWHRRTDGDVFPCEVTLTPVELNRASVLLVVWHDLTERKRAEAALRASEERLRQFVRTAPAAVAMFDREMRYLAYSRRWQTDFRLGDGDLTGGSLAATFPDYPGRWEEVHARCLAGASEERAEDTFTRPDGAVDYLRWEAQPWPDAAGGVGGLILFTEVVTDQVRVRRRAQIQHAAAQALAASSLSHAVSTVLQAVCRHMSWEVGEYWQAAADGLTLRFVAGWHVPAAADFAGASAGFTLARGQGLPGRVWVAGRPHHVPDLSGDPEFLWAAAWSGLRSAVAFPVVVGGRVVGVIDFVTSRPAALGADDQAMLDGLAGQVGQRVERARTEEALRESVERFRGAFEHAAIGMALVAPDGHWLRVNRSLCEIVGYTEEELRTRTFQDITHPDDLAADVALVGQILAGDIPTYAMEKRYYHKSGRVVRVLLNVSLVRDAAGQPLYFVSQIKDITARKQAEEDLRRTRGQLLDAIESLDAGIVMYGPDERLIVCNTRYKEIYPAVAADMVPGAWSEDILRAFCRAGGGPPAGPTADEWVARQLAAHRAPASPSEQQHGGRWIRVSDRRTRDGGLVSLRTDVTDLKEAQHAAEGASRAKSEFVANMSHEIRTPMNGILGMTELVLETDLTRDQRESLGLVKSSAVALLGVINDVLDFSKIEAGKLDLNPTPLVLRDLVEDTLKALARGAHEKGLELICALAPDLPGVVTGDPVRLRQVLTNLVGNAIKFTDRGEVVIRAEADAGADGYRLRVAVSDTGIGIPADRLQAVFDPFVQADGSTTRKYGGTGLGLTICSRLVGLMGGRVWAESEVGLGSTFRFEVGLGRAPAAAAALAAGADQAAAAPPPPGGDRGARSRALRVLLAEDQPVNQRYAVRLLEKLGHTITVAGTGREAVAAAAARPFDLILMDVQMPEVDGFEATGLIRRAEAGTGRRTPVVAITAHAMKGDRERCLAAGMDDYLSKPVVRDELLEVLARVAARPAAPGPAAGPPGATAGPAVYDRETALDRVDGDAALLAELAGLFRTGAGRVLGDIRRAVTTGNAADIRRAAHGLKGSAGCLGGTATVEAAARLEVIGAVGDLPAAAGALAALDRELSLFVAALGATSGPV